MPIAYKEDPELKRLESLDYLTKVVPKLFETPAMSRTFSELIQSYYSECDYIEILWRNDQLSTTKRKERLDAIKEHISIKIANKAKYTVLFDKELLAEQTAYLFHLVKEYSDTHYLAFERLLWTISMPAKSIPKFIKAMNNIERACISKKGDNPRYTLTVDLSKDSSDISKLDKED